MSVNAGARLVRVQPAHLHRLSSITGFSPDSNQTYVNLCRASRSSTYSKAASLFQTRRASGSTVSQRKSPDSHSHNPRGNLPTKEPSPKDPFQDTLNPPASTRPPKLDLPVRDASTGFFVHLFRLGKAYTTFYKTGLSAVITNRRLLRAHPDTPSSPTRATLQLRARVRHDSARLPLFGLIALVCGEFTPLIVLVFPKLTPYTCRIPAQVAVIQRAAEARRQASFRALSYKTADADGHICRSLGLGSVLWDKAGYSVPFARGRAEKAVQFIVEDDALLRDGGGVALLVDEEVIIACEERGIDTLGKEIPWLRAKLEAWVARTRPTVKDADSVAREATEKTRALLLGGV